jgi:hypothetical protein
MEIMLKDGIYICSWGIMSIIYRIYTTGSVLKSYNTAVRICHADHMAPSIRKKLALTSPTSDGRSVGIVRLRTKATEYVSKLSFNGCSDSIESLVAQIFATVPCLL